MRWDCVHIKGNCFIDSSHIFKINFISSHWKVKNNPCAQQHITHIMHILEHWQTPKPKCIRKTHDHHSQVTHRLASNLKILNFMNGKKLGIVKNSLEIIIVDSWIELKMHISSSSSSNWQFETLKLHIWWTQKYWAK